QVPSQVHDAPNHATQARTRFQSSAPGSSGTPARLAPRLGALTANPGPQNTVKWPSWNTNPAHPTRGHTSLDIRTRDRDCMNGLGPSHAGPHQAVLPSPVGARNPPGGAVSS